MSQTIFQQEDRGRFRRERGGKGGWQAAEADKGSSAHGTAGKSCMLFGEARSMLRQVREKGFMYWWVDWWDLFYFF